MYIYRLAAEKRGKYRFVRFAEKQFVTRSFDLCSVVLLSFHSQIKFLSSACTSADDCECAFSFIGKGCTSRTGK